MLHDYLAGQSKKFVTYNKFSSQNNVRKYHPDGMKRFYNTLLNANHSQIQNKSVIIKSAESLEILQKIRQIALWDVAIMDKVRKKGGKKARQFKVAELQRSKMHKSSSRIHP